MPVTLITLEHLTRAMHARMGLPADEAEANAEHVLDLFGFDSEILDNVLEPQDRQLFYSMERHGLVTARSEETQLWQGQDWRTHIWHMRAERVLEAGAWASAPAVEQAAEDTAEVYAHLPSDCWARR